MFGNSLGVLLLLLDLLQQLISSASAIRRVAPPAQRRRRSGRQPTTRGFTGHEQLDDVDLVHMNGRVYDPLLARFGTPDPMTENPFSTQGWNRYAYVGNSPLNFTDPSGYCFMGCFWNKAFKAIGNFLRKVPIIGTILQIAAAALCGPCAALVTAAVAGLTSGNLGLAIKAGIFAIATFMAFQAVGDFTGLSRDWLKSKCSGWKAANQERWRMFQSSLSSDKS